jgi:hypothetical protein
MRPDGPRAPMRVSAYTPAAHSHAPKISFARAHHPLSPAERPLPLRHRCWRSDLPILRGRQADPLCASWRTLGGSARGGRNG